MVSHNKGKSIKYSFFQIIQRLGNRLPTPFSMFIYIIIIILVLSAIASYIGFSAVSPITGELVKSNNLLSGWGLRRFIKEMVTNFSHFAPVGVVIVMLMGVSVAEQSGLLKVIFRKMAFVIPRSIIIPIIFIIGICANIGSDAGIVIIPPIAALIFSRIGINPVAGLIAGYTGATAGYSANIFITGTDVLLSGITADISTQLNPTIMVNAASNWYFMAVSTIILAAGGTFIVNYYTVPKCNKLVVNSVVESDYDKNSRLSATEKSALKHAGWSVIVYISIICCLVIPKGAILRDPETGSLVPSPFLDGLVPILFFFFIIPGYIYGKQTGTIKKGKNLVEFMEKGIKDLSGYIVLMLVVAQFINLFNWSNMDTILAIKGAEFLKKIQLTGPLLLLAFILLVSILNVFIGSASAKWAILAPVFIPMLTQLGYSAPFVQLVYRIGDSVTNAISPFYIYFPLLIGWIKKYDKNISIGTVFSLLIPYIIIFFVLWIVLLFIWVWLKLPIGVGEEIAIF